MGEGNPNLHSSSSPSLGGVSINKQLREMGVCMGPDFYNSNPWVRLLGRANESEIEIDGQMGIVLIYSGAMISMMSREYCAKHGYEIQPLDQLVQTEVSGGEHPLFRLCRG